MLVKYRNGFSNHLENIRPVLIALTAFAGGYTINDFPSKFKELFATPIGQFMVYFLILYLTFRSDANVSIAEIIMEAVMYVVILQLLKMLLKKIFHD